MQPAKGAGNDSFVRIAYFDYNAVNRQYEYFSLDSRAPQMMNERSATMEESTNAPELKLDGSTFVAPRWGDATNVSFNYRLTMSEIQNGRQTVRLYFTPQSGTNAQEFLAFEYIYTRRR